MLYSTISNYINEVILPALGEFASEFDVEAIARDMLTRHDVYTTDGWVNASLSGYVERDDMGFWTVVESHAF